MNCDINHSNVVCNCDFYITIFIIYLFYHYYCYHYYYYCKFNSYNKLNLYLLLVYCSKMNTPFIMTDCVNNLHNDIDSEFCPKYPNPNVLIIP